MKLDLLDAYYIRARLSASVVLLSPIPITALLCFEEINAIISSSVFIFILLAFTNYIPLLQRRFCQGKTYYTDCAKQLLLPSNPVINDTTKRRYYKKLSKVDDSFKLFENPNESDDFKECCDSVVSYLRENTRNDHHVQEENINYGFCKNLLATKPFGIILTIFLLLVVVIFSFVRYNNLAAIPTNNYFAFFANIVMLVFWLLGINKKMLEKSAIYYAKTLLSKIDCLDK